MRRVNVRVIAAPLIHKTRALWRSSIAAAATTSGYESGARTLAIMYIKMYILHMAKRYSIADARSNLPSIVDQAAAGQEIELTRRGKPVAAIVSLRELERLRGERVAFAEAYRRFLKAHPLDKAGVDEDFFESTRDRDPGRKVSL
jgi:prevent-host-death family protein